LVNSEHTVLLTGATAGIGYELAKIFAREGYPLILVSRNGERLAKVAEELTGKRKAAVKTIAKDLTRREAPQEIFAEVQQAAKTVDILVNNAGMGTYGSFPRCDLQKQLDMIQVNVTALTHLTGLFLPSMLDRGSGKILNVASTAAFQPGPKMAVYYATKAYVLNFSEALAYEMRKNGVTVSALCPGPTTTEFQSRARMEKARLVQSAMMDAKTVAEAGYDGLMRGKRVIIPGFKNKLLAFSTRFASRKTTTAIAGYMMKEK
jgi:short-subunit dehydrogenase